MPEEARKKGKHLTWEDRHEIQRGLREHRTFTEIAMAIGCSPDTVSKEIRNHRYHKPQDNKRFRPNRCKFRDTCRKRNVCGKKGIHKCKIPCSERTLYTYISKGYLSVRNIDMRRTVRYRKRKHTEEARISPIKKINHHYKDFLRELEENPGIRVVEMDTVIGTKGGKILQTIYWRKEKLMVAYLLESKEMSRTVATYDRLEQKLGYEKFCELFPIVLTDNGAEFANPDLFEYGITGNRRMKLFFCDPRRSEQKGEIEKNHEFIRYFLPQGTSFDELTQEKVDRMMSHINSTARPSLKGKTPLELALQHFGKDTVEKLGLHVIEPDNVCLKPELLK